MTRCPPMLSLGAAVAVAATGLSLVAAAPANAATSTTAAKFGYTASAYGTYATVGSLLKSSPTAASGLSCLSAAGSQSSNSIASVSIPGLATIGAVTTHSSSSSGPSSVSTTATANVGAVSLLGGEITASAIHSVSATTYDKDTQQFSTSAAGSSVAGLMINGQTVAASPPPNTRIKLPGIGYVLLNSQLRSGKVPNARLTVQGIVVVVTVSGGTFPLGVHLVVSSAISGLSGPSTTLFTGEAHATNAKLGTTISAGNLASVGLACAGSATTTRTASVAAASVPNLLTTGTIQSTAVGSSTTGAHMTSAVQNLNVLLGVLSVSAIKADVSATAEPTHLADNSSFVGLNIPLLPNIGDNVAPNTTINLLPGVTVRLHQVIKTPGRITVIMVQVEVTGPNLLGLTNGLKVNVGVATARAV